MLHPIKLEIAADERVVVSQGVARDLLERMMSLLEDRDVMDGEELENELDTIAQTFNENVGTGFQLFSDEDDHGEYDGQPTEMQEWHDFDPDC